MASGKWFLREVGSKAALLSCAHGDTGTAWCQPRAAVGSECSYGLPGPPPRPRAPVQDALPHHRPTCPHHEPTRAHNPPMSSTSPLSEHTSASHSCISVGSVRTLADGCSAAGQATKPFLTGALPCELCGERPVREQNSPVHPKARAPTRTQALRSKPATALQKVCECGIAKG